MSDADVKIRENRLRRMATRQGLLLQKSRVRDPRAVQYGGYFVVDQAQNLLLTSDQGMTLDEVEAFLAPGTPAETSARKYAEVRKLLENMAKQVKSARAFADRARRNGDDALAEQFAEFAHNTEGAATEIAQGITDAEAR